MGIEQDPSVIQVQEIAKDGEIPSDFIRCLNLEEEPAEVGKGSIPVIDMATLVSADREGLMSLGEIAGADEVDRAFREWGAFQIVNHGVPSELWEKLMELVLDFFHRPLEERVIDYRETIHPQVGRDWVDAVVHVMKPRSASDPIPIEEFPEGYGDVLMQYGDEVLKLIKILQRVSSVKLGLSPTRIEEASEELQTVARMNYYPPCPRPELVTGFTAHSDVDLITVLLENKVEGLQVCKDRRWITMKPLPNSLVVLAGDMLQIMTNGAYVSAEHRTFASQTERLSFGVFASPRGDLRISPLPDLLDEHHPARYESVLTGEHAYELINKGLTKKTLTEIRGTLQ